jgi:hypothetical protein
MRVGINAPGSRGEDGVGYAVQLFQQHVLCIGVLLHLTPWATIKAHLPASQQPSPLRSIGLSLVRLIVWVVGYEILR